MNELLINYEGIGTDLSRERKTGTSNPVRDASEILTQAVVTSDGSFDYADPNNGLHREEVSQPIYREYSKGFGY